MDTIEVNLRKFSAVIGYESSTLLGYFWANYVILPKQLSFTAHPSNFEFPVKTPVLQGYFVLIRTSQQHHLDFS